MAAVLQLWPAPPYYCPALWGGTSPGGLMEQAPKLDEARKPYQAPKLEHFGTLREITLAGGSFNAADAVNPFNRYTPIV